ncbi:MAG: sulfite exporter TauE/SafE family protein, partial [Nitrospirota bacterium]
LTTTAATIGFLHTVLGPDHYLPFVVMGRAGGWSRVRTLAVTAVCGVGHIAGSVLLGGVGGAAGIAVSRMAAFEAVRGDVAAWALIGIGAAYAAWGVRRALRNRPHTHLHHHGDGTLHAHAHTHHRDHAHLHGSLDARKMTPWLLFVIFVLGPCEPLIPLLMVPAARHSALGVAWVAAVFGVVTIVTMVGLVLAGTLGVERLPLGGLERYSHAMAGATLCLCGVGIVAFGL